VVAIATQAARVNDALGRSADTLAGTIEGRGREIDALLGLRFTALEDTIRHARRGAGRPAGRGCRFAGPGGRRPPRGDGPHRQCARPALAAAVAEKAREAGTIVESQLGALEERSARRSAEIATTFDALITKIDQTLGGRATALNEALVIRTGEIARVMASGGREVAKAIELRADEVGLAISAKTSLFGENLAAKADDINRLLGERVDEIGASLDHRAERFEDRVVHRLEDLAARLDERGERSGLRWAPARPNSSILFDTRSRGVDESIAARSRALIEHLDQRHQEVNEAFGTRTRALVDLRRRAQRRGGLDLSGQADAFARVFDDRSEAMSSLIDSRMGAMTNQLDEGGRMVFSALGTRITEIARLFDRGGASLADLLDHRGQTLLTTLGDRVSEITELFDRSTGALTGTLGERTAEIAELLDRSTGTLRQTLGAQASDFREIFDRSGEICPAQRDRVDVDERTSLSRTRREPHRRDGGGRRGPRESSSRLSTARARGGGVSTGREPFHRLGQGGPRGRLSTLADDAPPP
jgi:hypothetical protein